MKYVEIRPADIGAYGDTAIAWARFCMALGYPENDIPSYVMVVKLDHQ